MKTATIAILCVLMAGCDYYSVTPEQINKANELCEKNGGVDRIVVIGKPLVTIVMDHVSCNSGATFSKNHIPKSN